MLCVFHPRPVRSVLIVLHLLEVFSIFYLYINVNEFVFDFCRCSLLFVAVLNRHGFRYDRKLARYISSVQDISGGAQIRTIFNNFLEDLHGAPLSASALTDGEIEKAMAMH